MSDSIVLHKEKGLNAHMTVCRYCGKDVGIAMLGARDGIYTCKHDHKSIGGPPPRDAKIPCGCQSRDFRRERTIEDYEKLAVEICDDCIKLQTAADEEVKKGGIYWRCVDCGSAGAIKADHVLSKDVRKRTKVEAPDPCGTQPLHRVECYPFEGHGGMKI